MFSHIGNFVEYYLTLVHFCFRLSLFCLFFYFFILFILLSCNNIKFFFLLITIKFKNNKPSIDLSNKFFTIKLKKKLFKINDYSEIIIRKKK